MPEELKDRLLFSRKEAAKLLGVSIRTVDRMIAARELTIGRSKFLAGQITRDSLASLVTSDAREAA